MLREYDAERFRRLALYIASRSVNDPAFGKTKLAKILFYSDFTAYLQLGQSITGAIYSKFPRGPFPKVMGDELEKIVSCGQGILASTPYFGKGQERLVAVKDVDAGMFTGSEISIVEQVIEALRGQDASGVAALSHAEPAWQTVRDWEPIPYDLAFVSVEPPNDRAVEQGQRVAQRLGLATDPT